MKLAQDVLRLVAATALALAACTAPEPVPLTPPKDAAGAAVIRTPVPAEAAPPAAGAAPSTQGSATPSVVVPPGAQYVCVSEIDGERRQTAIEFAPRVAQLCKRHPEMGPCQYERNLCRRSGGRVYATGGVEITMATEAEYDRKVLRVRFRSD